MAGLLARYRYVLIIIMLIVVPAGFGASYFVNSGGVKQFTITASDTGYNLALTMRHPAYFFTGEPVPANLTVRMQFGGDYTKAELKDFGVEVRYPAKINSTTGVVQTWRVLSTSEKTVGFNYTGSTSASKLIQLTMVSPPSNGLGDVFLPSSNVAINGFVDMILFGTDGGNALITPVSISLLDSQTVYQTQLSTVASTNAWLVYELLAALLASQFFAFTKATAATPAARAYGLELESFRVKKKLEALEEFLSSGKMSRDRYGELKESYDKEVAQLKTIDKTTA